jgi:hypothetical protein
VTSHWTMISSITVSSLLLTISLCEIKGSDITLNDDFQYHSQFIDTDNIAQWDQRKWRHTERWFAVSQSVCWYWQYRSVRSKEVTSHWTMNCSITVSLLILTISLSEIKGSDVTLNDDLQYHSQLVDTDSIAQWDQRIAQWDQRKTSEIKGKPVRSKDRSVRSKDRSVRDQRKTSEIKGSLSEIKRSLSEIKGKPMRSKEKQWDQRKTSEIKGSLSEIKGKLSKWTIILFFNGWGNIWSSEPSGFSCYFLFRFMTLEILHCYAPSRIVVENGGLVVIL